MKISEEVESIVDSALNGKQIGREEILRLCEVDELSLDAAYITWAGRELWSRANDGVAEIHAQIGIDSNPCSKNCLFCSFAAINTARKDPLEMPYDEILEYAKAYIRDGANLIDVMITGDYDFDKYIDIMTRLRQDIGDEMPLAANAPDLTLEDAKRLKDAGVNAIFHAVRMGDGELTRTPLEDRFATLRNAKEAGLKVQTCLEMIIPRYSDERFADLLLKLVAEETDSLNVSGMVNVPGTKMENEPRYIRPRYVMYTAIARMAASPKTWLGGPILSWAEVGTNPRDDSNKTEKFGLGADIAKLRETQIQNGWIIHDGPSKKWL